MEKQKYITLEDAFKIRSFSNLIKSGAYFPCIGSNSDGCSTLGMDPDTNDLRIGKRNRIGGNWKAVDPNDFNIIEVYPGNVIYKSTTS